MARERRDRAHGTSRPMAPPADVPSLPVAAAVLSVATIVAYLPSLRAGFNLLDDHTLLRDNPLMSAADGLYRIWFTADAIDYWPVFNSALWLQWRLWGTDPLGYHISNLALHVGDTLLLWVVLRKLALPGSFLAALLFALHPVNVESVAWIAQLKNLLALGFALLSVMLFLDSNVGRADGAARRLDLRYAASLTVFAVAMLSKGSVVVLPAFLLAVIAWRRPLTRRDVVHVVPFVVVGGALAVLTSLFRGRFGTEVRELGVTERVLEAAASFWFYLYKALIPLRLSFIYPKWEVQPAELQWWLPAFALLGVTVVLWRYRSRVRPLLFAWVLFGAALVPAVGMLGAGFMEKWSVADHYQHVALIPVVVLLAATWAIAWQHADRFRLPADAIAAAAVAAFALLTWRQNTLYVDPISLYRASLHNHPDSAFARNSLGVALLSAGRADEARVQFEDALRLRADYLEVRSNLATALIALGHLPEATAQLREALRLKPDDIEAETNLAAVLWQSGKTEEAIAHYQNVLRIRPDHPDAHYNLGRALYQDGRRSDAIEHFRAAVRANPNHAAAHNALGVALAEAGQRADGVRHVREATRLDPNDAAARANLAELLGAAAVAAPPQ